MMVELLRPGIVAMMLGWTKVCAKGFANAPVAFEADIRSLI
jgi:hypothetical protein